MMDQLLLSHLNVTKIIDMPPILQEAKGTSLGVVEYSSAAIYSHRIVETEILLLQNASFCF
jgi:hypothetical protein